MTSCSLRWNAYIPSVGLVCGLRSGACFTFLGLGLYKCTNMKKKNTRCITTSWATLNPQLPQSHFFPCLRPLEHLRQGEGCPVSADNNSQSSMFSSLTTQHQRPSVNSGLKPPPITTIYNTPPSSPTPSSRRGSQRRREEELGWIWRSSRRGKQEERERRGN